MGLSSSMWASVSGLLSHGNKMNVVTNNIANVSTIGFKSQRMDFNDYLYLSGSSVSGPTQIGAGVSTYAVIGDFSQGSFESTNSATDIAIDGSGYFGVRAKGGNKIAYTRAGDFYFNADRELQNPEGMLVQGWKINNKKDVTFSTGATNLSNGKTTESAYVGSGSPTDIILKSWNVAPQRTTNVQFTVGLENNPQNDKTTNESSPMTALFDLWDATRDTPLPDEAYAYKSDIKVYDEGGSTHQMTVYYDMVESSKIDESGDIVYLIDGLPEGYTMYEYLVTIPPEEDTRSYGGTDYNEDDNIWTGNQPTKFYNDPVEGTNKKAGVLMSGVLIFNSSGQLVNQTAYTYGGQEAPDPGDQIDTAPSDKSIWQPTRFSSNGLPVFTANFTGQPLANSVTEMMEVNGTEVSQAQDYIMELNLGLKNMGPNWDPIPAKKLFQDANDLYEDENTPTIKLEKNNYGYYTTTGAGNKVYGKYNNNDVIHNGTNWEADGVEIIDPEDIAQIAFYTPRKVDVDTPTSLADLTTRFEADGNNIFRNVVAYRENVPLMDFAERQEDASICNVDTFITEYAGQDGYPYGTLSSVSIDTDGVIYGYYDNGEILGLYQITMYDFHNEQGLYREGGNLFSQTKASGEPRIGVAGDDGFGSTMSYNIEQSNVDLSRELVQMITTQRGFQANSKGVTTTDMMMEVVINMKR
ncbi:MAG: flagellar hook-basal body complex protein [Desulfovibrio sp.]|nr:flagellar hook-basal body complex protein [Desulfovibrio sp.]